jgi:hypothetical protein
VPRRKVQPGLLSPADAADISARLEWLEQRAVVAATGGLVLTEGPGGTVIRQPPVAEVAPSVPVARFYHSANQTISTGTPSHALSFDSTRYNPGGFSMAGTPATKLTVPADGYYLFGAQVEFQSNSTGYRFLELRPQGLSNPAAADVLQQAPPATCYLEIVTLWFLLAGGYMEAYVQQNSGGNLLVPSDSGVSPEFWVARLG